MHRTMMLLALVFAVCLAGSVANAQVIPLEGEVPNAAAFHLTPNGLQFIGEVAAGLLVDYNWDEILYSMNPLFEVTSCALIFMGTADISDYSIDDLSIEISSTSLMGLNPQPNGLYVRILLYPAAGEPLIELTIDGAWGVGCTDDFVATAGLMTDPLELGASITLDYTPGVGFEIVVQEVKLGNEAPIPIEFTGLPDPTLEELLQTLIDSVAGDLVAALLPDLINEALAEQLEGVLLEGTSEVGDYTLLYAFSPDFESDQYGFMVETDARLYIEGDTVDPCIDPGDEIGSPYTAGAMPPFDSVLTPGGDPYDIAMVFSDDLFNQLIYSFLAKGELCLMFPFEYDGDQGLTLADFAGLFPDYPLDADLEDAANLIDLYPIDLPRIVVGDNDTDLALVAQPYHLDWYIEVEERYVAMLTADLNLNLALSLDLDDDNNLLIVLNEELSTIHFTVHGSEWNILPPALLETLLNGLIEGFLLPLIADAFPPIPLPSLMGYQLTIHEIGATGPSNDYFGLFCELTEAPTAADRPQAGFALPGFGIADRRFLNAPQSVAAGLAGATPVLHLASLSDRPVDHYLARVDGGIWRLVRNGELDLSLLLDGRHLVEAIAVSSEGFVSARPAKLSFLLDRVAPRLDSALLRREGDRWMIKIQAHDYVAAAERLRYQYRLVGGPWSWPLATDTLRLPLGLPSWLPWQVRASDPSGNASQPMAVRPGPAPQIVTPGQVVEVAGHCLRRVSLPFQLF